MPTGTGLEYRYPEDIAVLYDNKQKNYIKFSRIEYHTAKYIDGIDQKFEMGYEMKESVVLELPGEINLPESHDWGSGELFSTKSIFTEEGFEGVTDRVLTKLAGRAVEKALGLIGNTIDPDVLKNQYLFEKGKTIINPNTTMIYNGTGVRTLNMDFVFSPKNESEAKMLQSIFYVFRQSSRGRAETTGINTPDMWVIKTSSKELDKFLDFGYQDKEGVKQFAGTIPFVLTNFNPSMKTNFLYHNEYPSEISLMIEFSELRPKYRYVENEK